MARALHFVAAETSEAETALAALRGLYTDAGPEKAAVVVALGGDGFMLQTLHTFLGKGKPIYGMHLGSVGFLMNEYREAGLEERLEQVDRLREGQAGRGRFGCCRSKVRNPCDAVTSAVW